MAKSPAYRRQQAGRREERVDCWVVFNGLVYGLYFYGLVYGLFLMGCLLGCFCRCGRLLVARSAERRASPSPDEGTNTAPAVNDAEWTPRLMPDMPRRRV